MSILYYIRNIARKTMRDVAGVIAVLLVCVIVMMIALQGAVFWLNTERGGAWLAARLDGVMLASGYTLEMEAFSLSGVLGLKAGRVIVAQGDVRIAEIDDLAVRVNPWPLKDHRLDVALTAGRVVVHNTPAQATQAQDKEQGGAVSLPSVYFTTLDLGVSVDKLIMMDAVLAGGFQAQLDIRETVTLSENLARMRGHVLLSDLKHAQAGYIPRAIRHDVAFDTATQRVSLDDLRIESALYQLGTTGFYELDGQFDIGVNGVAYAQAQGRPDGLVKPVDIALNASGRVDQFTGAVRVGSQYKDIPLTLRANIARDGAVVNLSRLVIENTIAQVSGDIRYNIARAVATGDVTAALDDLAKIGRMVDVDDVAGRVDVTLSLLPQSGQQAARLRVDIRDASYQDIAVTEARVKAAVADVRALQPYIHALQNGDSVLSANPDLDVTAVLRNVGYVDHEHYDVRLNADVAMVTQDAALRLKGKITPERISVHIPDSFNESIPSLNIEDVAQEGDAPQNDILSLIGLDLNFAADNGIFVSGRGLNAELGGVLDIGGTLAKPLVEGELSTIRGRFKEFGRRFDIAKAILRFQGAMPPSPYLDVETTTEVEDVTAKILITGGVSDPTIQMTATPTLPEDEVLSLILFGKDIADISGLQAAQLANALRKFSGKGGGSTIIDPLQTIQDITGLDDIRVDGIGTENATVGAGKYVADNVYVEVETGAAAASGAVSVEIELTPHITAESSTGQNGESNVGVFWEWDY